MNGNYELLLQKAIEMIEVACISNKLTGSNIEMANIVCGIGKMGIGGNGVNHNYHAVLDAAYELFQTKPNLDVDKNLEAGIKCAIEKLDTVECKKIIMDLIIDQLEREKNNKAAFKLPCNELLKALDNSIAESDINAMFNEDANKKWFESRTEYINKNFK